MIFLIAPCIYYGRPRDGLEGAGFATGFFLDAVVTVVLEEPDLDGKPPVLFDVL